MVKEMSKERYLTKILRKVNLGTATGSEKRKYRIFIREEAKIRKAQKIVKKITM